MAAEANKDQVLKIRHFCCPSRASQIIAHSHAPLAHHKSSGMTHAVWKWAGPPRGCGRRPLMYASSGSRSMAATLSAPLPALPPADTYLAAPSALPASPLRL